MISDMFESCLNSNILLKHPCVFKMNNTFRTFDTMLFPVVHFLINTEFLYDQDIMKYIHLN